MIASLREIARALGGEVSGNQVNAPGPGHGPLNRSLSVRLSASSLDGFIVHSFAGDDWRDCRDYVRQRLGIAPDAWRDESRRPTPSRDVDDAERLKRALASAKRIASELVPLSGTPGEVYLRQVRRNDTVAIKDVLSRIDAIGWHPAVYFNEPGHHFHQRKLGCVVGVMTDPVTATPTGAISRTYVAPDGTKVGKAKTLGRPVGIVRLSPDDEVTQALCLAEGQETALSGMSIGLRPMWSTGSSGLLAGFPVLPGVQALTVFVDHDVSGAGEKAARQVEAPWVATTRARSSSPARFPWTAGMT